MVMMETKEEHANVILLKSTLKKLHFGSWEEKEVAAKEIETFAKEDAKVRKMVAELGVVPVLVSMVGSKVATRRLAGLKALIQLANGSYQNKTLIVEAGILSKLPRKVDLEDESTTCVFAHLLSSLSHIANTQFPHHDSLHFLPLLSDMLKSCSSRFDTKESCLEALYNLSTVLENSGPLVSNGIVPVLLELSLVKNISEKALACVGNLALTLVGKKAIENNPMVPECLIEVISWDDKPKCQEFSAYILMILAHQNSSQREKMAKLGIVPVLIEVALLGSPLAQKRALKLLQWFKDKRQKMMGPHRGSQFPRRALDSPVNQRGVTEGKRIMKSLVAESLHWNMKIITQRANAAGHSSKLKSLVISTSSKRLPY